MFGRFFGARVFPPPSMATRFAEYYSLSHISHGPIVFFFYFTPMNAALFCFSLPHCLIFPEHPPLVLFSDFHRCFSGFFRSF